MKKVIEQWLEYETIHKIRKRVEYVWNQFEYKVNIFKSSTEVFLEQKMK